MTNAVDQVWSQNVQQDKLDHFVIKEMNRGSFAEIVEVDEDNYRSNVVSKRSFEKLNYDRRKSDCLGDGLGVDHRTDKKGELKGGKQNKKDLMVVPARVSKRGNDEQKINKSDNNFIYENRTDINNDAASVSAKDENTSRSQTYISLSPSNKRSFHNDSFKEFKRQHSEISGSDDEDRNKSPLYHSNHIKSVNDPNKSYVSKFAEYKHKVNSPAINNANNHININISINNDKNKDLPKKRHSLHANPVTVSYKPIIDEIKRRRNLTVKDKYNKSLSFTTQSANGFITGLEAKKNERSGRLSIDNKKLKLHTPRG